jgi:putative CocE/NonD family hydrolase
MNDRSFQIMVPMRDGTRLNTFVFLPDDGGPRWPAILHRTPYGIAAVDAPHKFDHTRAWLPNPTEPMRGSILRGWKAIVEHGYVAVYQDCRGRHGSEGEDRVYALPRASSMIETERGHIVVGWLVVQDLRGVACGMLAEW